MCLWISLYFSFVEGWTAFGSARNTLDAVDHLGEHGEERGGKRWFWTAAPQITQPGWGSLPCFKARSLLPEASQTRYSYVSQEYVFLARWHLRASPKASWRGNILARIQGCIPLGGLQVLILLRKDARASNIHEGIMKCQHFGGPLQGDQ